MLFSIIYEEKNDLINIPSLVTTKFRSKIPIYRSRYIKRKDKFPRALSRVKKKEGDSLGFDNKYYKKAVAVRGACGKKRLR